MAAAVGAESSRRRPPRLIYIETQNRARTHADASRTHVNRVESILNWKMILQEEFGHRWGFVLLFVIALLFFRLVGARMVVSFFDPDEYWQSMEVAHQISFDYGHLTWEWEQSIRSYLHPLLFAAIYTSLDKLGLDTPWMVQWTPRMAQAVILVAQDIGVYLLALRMFPKRYRSNVASWSLTFELVLWFNTYCGVRTYSNCLETCLILWGLLFWPFPDETAVSIGSKKISLHPVLPRSTSKHMIISLFFAGFSVAVRPTAAIFWINLALSFLMGRSTYSRTRFLTVTAGMAIFWISILVGTDRVMYGSWVFVPLNFINFNVLRGVGSYYGNHPMHWYFSNALPVILFTLLPLFLYGCFRIIRQQISWRSNRPHQSHGCHGWSLLFAILNFILLFSLLGHKEFRFLYPIVPLMMVVSGYGAHCFYSRKRGGGQTKWKKLLLVLLMLANVPMLIYFSVGHQVGTTSVLEHIQQDNTVESVYFLVPCHQTPFYSFIHRNISLAFPDCSPPVGDDPSIVGYQTETSNLLSNAEEFVAMLFDSDSQTPRPSWLAKNSLFPQPLPSHFVTYEKLAQQISEFFTQHNYKECERFYHTMTPLDDIQSDVVLYCKEGK
uniref:Mannosyltransferase n=1 Tax=Vannella robusta TaxID=1487602 RepID=A0A7S4MRE3_9EUKA|mmetsp:Transcript_7722/g.9564  ORF Transcript_7722/g.9564 Transcript_7722/m.9564 type:complete len:609 (+) Transcript_7722:42-1868(+)